MNPPTDLGLQRTYSSTAYLPEDVARLPHPAKLQHSPSLPDIRSPVDTTTTTTSGTTHEMAPVTENTQRPSAPPSPKTTAPASQPEKVRATRHVKYASIDPSSRKPSGGHKTHARRRTDRDQPHSLLTPPLTPSSSIRTTASISTEYSATSTAHSAHNHQETAKNGVVEDIVDPDPEATRILVLENVRKNVVHGTLKCAINDAFKRACVASGASPVPLSSEDGAAPRELLKGLNQRLQATEGKVYALFYDARVTKVIVDFLASSDAAASVFKNCTETQFGEATRAVRPVTARAGSLDETHQNLGRSEFLRDLDSSFSLSVQKFKAHDDEEESASLEKAVDEGTSAEHASGASGIDVAIVLNMLKTFGDLRSFKFARHEVNQDLSSTFYYSVEYFDARDCDSAWIELDNATKYGLTLRIAGNKLKPQPDSPSATGPGQFPAGLHVAGLAEAFNNININAPGVSSQLRLPFFHPPGVEVNAVGALPPPGNGASSPPFFYVTSTGEPGQPPYPPPDAADVGAQVLALAQRPPSTPFLEEQWGNEHAFRPGAVSPCYNADGGACSYCPSRGAFPGVPYTFNAFTTPPPATPMVYYPPPMPSTPRLLPPPHPQPWNFDPSAAANAGGPGGPQPMLAPPPPGMGGMMTGPPASPVPFFLREGGSGVHGGGARGLPFPIPYPPFVNGRVPVPFSPGKTATPSPAPGEAPPRMAKAGARSGRALFGRTASPPFQHAPDAPVTAATDTLAAAAAAAGSSAPAQDRNTLDLNRIREGLDTRTTIMIKNIPNKMSDSDLTAYIAKVCPRAIDFLYLRMDFRNGCNVGYAFVNFITVEDLLRFADARLGAKWNMFSSEKVLQMSYANYQSKESLIEKFKNSAIMDERESWRPRIFYSAGPMKGLPEPFPTPTHIRRKERSSHNRGTLFPPGMNSHNAGGHQRRVLVANNNPHLPVPSVSSPFASIGGRNPAGGSKPFGFRGKKFP